ncbi:DUF5129 domain-containing protein [Zafaria sp. Z1313]|uniref:DUF5129 domain-containing protein n=1 Tax=unclassified Zafaria TaxID=2828765 RepID=UPI002E7906E9|nr:DUF5129 domain-containing protein [Zafaria sp. J156]MEE1621666.1 DUF5129 domain-containing protein [Zafaria sp. J156]
MSVDDAATRAPADTGTRLIHARSRPRFGLPWLAIALGAATAAFAGTGAAALTAQPAAEVVIEVDDGLPYNISQATVDAVLPETIPAWEPVTVKVTSRLLSYAELYGEADPGYDVVLSTALENDTDSDADERFAGAAVRVDPPGPDRPRDAGFDINRAFQGNLGLGHGPQAVAAAARTASEVLHPGPVRTPHFWAAGTALGLLGTVGALGLSLRRRARWERRYRRLAAAQHRLARVVLDLEALEVTYLSTPEQARPAGFTRAWEALRDSSLAAARTEDAVVGAVSSRRTALTEGTEKRLAAFEAAADRLTTLADALLGAGAVHGGHSGGGSTFDRLAAPVNDAARELLVRLEAAPAGTLDEGLEEELRAALAGLLSVAGEHGAAADAAVEAARGADRDSGAGRRGGRARAGRNDAGRNDAGREGAPGVGVDAWVRAERRLGRAAGAVGKRLRRYPGGDRLSRRLRATEDLGALRAGLGLPRSGGALDALDRANAAARSLLGEVPAYDADASAAASARRRWSARFGGWIERSGLNPAGPGREGAAVGTGPVGTASSGVGGAKGARGGRPGAGRHRAAVWAVGGTAVVLSSLIASGIIVSSVTERPGWALTGGVPLRSLTVDGEAGGIDEASIRRYLEDSFPSELDVVVALRDAEEYLPIVPDPHDPGHDILDPAGTLDMLWRIKAEFPELVDPATRELRGDQAVLPVMVFDDGTVNIPTVLAGAVAVGDVNRLQRTQWTHGSFHASGSPEVRVASELEDLARGLQANGYRDADVDFWALYWLVAAALALGLVGVGQAVRYGGAMSASLGRFGRGGAGLRRAREELERLALGLDDSRLNAVAVLGAGAAGTAAEADQRLFERALVMAWREAEELAALPLAGRLGPRYERRVEHLQGLAAVLGERDADVERRTRRLLAAARPHPSAL